MPTIGPDYHPNTQYMRYRLGNPVRGRQLPHDSIWYRKIHDVPPVPNSDAILDWCMENWERPYIRTGVGNWEDHDTAANDPTNFSRKQPGYYLDMAPAVPTQRTIEMSGNPNTSTTPSRTEGLFRLTTGYFPGRSERRVKEGHARSQFSGLQSNGQIILDFGTTKPFHPAAGDRPTVTVWPSLQMTTETTNCDWGWNRDSRVGHYVQRFFDTNDWPVYWDDTKPDNRGSYAGANGVPVPLATLLLSYDELARGWVNHTMMCAVQSYSGGGVTSGAAIAHWPGARSDGEDEYAPGALEVGGPMGGHIFRLKGSFDIKGFTDDPLKRAFLRGCRDHGLILMDKHGSGAAGGPRAQGLNRPVNVLCAEHPLWDPDAFSFGEGVRGGGDPALDYIPGAMSPLTLDADALPMDKEYWEVVSLRSLQKLQPGRPRASTYPAVDEFGNPILNQDHWQCIMPGSA